MSVLNAPGRFADLIRLHVPWVSSSEDNESIIMGTHRYRGIDTSMAQLKEARNARCLLSLASQDGGGIRGFSQLLILEEIANRIMHGLGLQESPPLCDHFDMIGGVGTGGYLAILAGRLGLAVPQMKEEFGRLIATVLAGPISADELDRFLKAVVKRHTGDSETRMHDLNSQTYHCKTFVGAITTANISYLTIFRSYDSRHPLLDITIWQAARATLAHPDLFPPTHIGSPDFEQVYISGDLGWKNPSNEVIREFEALWSSQSIACLASIGSGHEGVTQMDGSSASEALANVEKRMATDCEKVAQEVAYRFQGRKNYFRLSVEQGLQQNIPRQPLTLSEIEAHTNSYLRSPDTEDALNQLVASLLQNIEVSAWTTTRDHFETTIDGYISEYTKLLDDILVEVVHLTAMEGVLILETIRSIKYDEDRWLSFAKMITNQSNSMNHRIGVELREPLSSNPLWASIKRYYAEMKVVRQSLKQLVTMNPHRIWGPPTHETFLAKATANLEESFKRIQNCVLNDIRDHMLSATRDARLEEFIAWLSILDMNKRHHDVRARRSQGTGTWLIETPEFKDWFENRALQKCRALLAFGDPGTGKTFICSFLIDYLRNILEKHRAALVYIYCDYSDKDRQDTCSMIAELAKQLLLQSSAVSADVWALFEKHTHITAEKAQQIFRLLSHCFESTYVCIDALDECSPSSRNALLRFLNTLKGESVYIFCAGRMSVATEATELLKQLGTTTMEIYAHETDLRRHIEAHIAQDSRKKAMDDQLQEEITRKLVSQSQKLFILPALQLQFILEHVTKRQRREALNVMPVELLNMYDITLGRIRQQPAPQTKMARMILTWLHLAQRRLRVCELQQALAVQLGDTAFVEDGMPPEEDLLECCLGLVVIERETATIRFTHFTLQEYLDKHWRELFPSGHSVIASTCVTYLNFEHPDSLSPELQTTSTLLEYAAQFLGDHLREATDEDVYHRAASLLINKAKFRLLEAAMSRRRHKGGFSPLHWVTHFGIIPLGKLLLLQTNNRFINVHDDHRRTPLSIAAKSGHEGFVELLLRIEDVDINSREESRRTPLSWAAENGHEAVVKILLREKGVEVNSKDYIGRTPLSRAAAEGHEAVVKLLLSAEGVRINSKDIIGRTPLSRAAVNGNEAIVKLLLNVEGVEVDSRDDSGQTPLSWAAENGHEGVVKMLLSEEGVEVDSKDYIGRTPLSRAAAEGHEAIVKLLLSAEGVGINSRDRIGRTPLSRAAANGNEAVVKLLLNVEGVEVDSRDDSGQTPLSRAAENGHKAVVMLLLARNEYKSVNPQ